MGQNPEQSAKANKKNEEIFKKNRWVNNYKNKTRRTDRILRRIYSKTPENMVRACKTVLGEECK